MNTNIQASTAAVAAIPDPARLEVVQTWLAAVGLAFILPEDQRWLDPGGPIHFTHKRGDTAPPRDTQ